jgi:UDP-N-acetylmuramoyl-tripeptide--D-alanyl-D-alanine ligase
MKPIQVQKLTEIINGVAEGIFFSDEVPGVSIDSRTIKPGEIFWTINGVDRDGSQFSEQALQAGAVGVVVSQQNSKNVTGPKIVVEDTLVALQQFAKWYRDQFDICLIGVTGSFGKTTTREMIYSVLSQNMEGIRSRENFNNHIGVPLTLLEIEAYHQFAVIEMGASSIGEIDMLSKMASPEIGVITGISASHLEGFGSVEKVVKAKSELFANLPTNGMAYLSGDIEYRDCLLQEVNCSAKTVGVNTEDKVSDADVRAENPKSNNAQIEFSVNGKKYQIPVAGQHFVNSALFAISIGINLDLIYEEIVKGLENIKPVSGRCHVKYLDSLTLIDDTYNSNPASMSAAFTLLSGWKTSGRKILVVGDMLELGELANYYHRKAGEEIAKSQIDYLVTCGECSKELIQGAISEGMPEECVTSFDQVDDSVLEHLKSFIKQDDVILIKGSRGMKMERIVEFICSHYSSLNSEQDQPEKICA